MANNKEKQLLGFWMCLALVVGNYIGSGIFLLPAQLAPYGWNATLGWGLTIAGALCLAFVFARLTRAMPLAAGPYAFVNEAFGPLPAFAVAWGYWIAIAVGNTAIAVAAVSYLSYFIPALAETPGLGALAAAGLLWTLTVVNILSIRLAGSVQLVTTFLKLLPLIAVIAIAAIMVGEGSAPVHTPFRSEDISLSAVSAAAALTLWAMLGVEAASVGSRNVANAERNVPRATMIGTLLVGIIYVAVSTPVALFLPTEQAAASNAPLADFVAAFWTPGLAAMVGLFAAISAIGALNGWILLQGEMPLAMARHGIFPAWVGALTRRGTPLRAHLISSAFATILIAANSSRTVAGLFVFMALLATAATLFLYLACALAALRLQRTERIERSALLTIMASLGAGYAVWTFAGAGAEATAWGTVLLATSVPVYFLMRWRAGSTPSPALAPAAPRE
ncbi:MAG TPA: amino acid permease [Sphingomicrobium sp.]|nr:amino acid permease [Sphingomicrobium sp.]